MTTKEFLHHFQNFAIQTFDDCNEKGKTKDPRLISCGKPSDYTAERIKQLNENGAGIYFTPNQFPEGIRKAMNCTGVNAWIVENDTLTIDEQWKNLEACPLLPSFIVQSKNSLHAYWLSKDGTIENYQKIVKGLIKYFQGDEACKDVSRVFRIPNFYHMKDRSKPYLVGLVHEHPELKYTEQQMMTAFPYEEPSQNISIFHRNTQTNDFWEMLGSLDNKSVLVRLSGQPIVNHEIIEFKKRHPVGEYIYINGQMCDGWLDEQGKIGSGKQGGPTWIQWLGFYNIPKSEIARWAKDNLVEVQHWVKEHETQMQRLETEKIKSQIEEIKTPKEKKDYKLRYTWGTRELDTAFAIIKRGNFIVVGAKRSEGKTTYTFDMAQKNAKLGHTVLYLSLEMDEDRVKENIARNYAGITIEEELDYKIPDSKQKAFQSKINEINAIPNLLFRGIRRASGTMWETLAELINDCGKVDLIFIDNLDLIEGKKGEDDIARQKTIVKNILSFTSEKQVPVILIHHYRKASQGKDHGMDEMAGSGKIADGADIIVKVMRNKEPEATYPDKYQTRMFLQKGRGYPESSKTIYFIKGTFVDTPPHISEYYNSDYTEKIAEDFEGKVIKF